MFSEQPVGGGRGFPPPGRRRSHHARLRGAAQHAQEQDPWMLLFTMYCMSKK